MTEHLRDLPSRGAIREARGSLIGRSAINYLCNHETDPPGNQVIRSDEPCILATCLQKAKQKDMEAKKKQKAEKAAEQSAKRKEGSTAVNAAPAKRQSTEAKTYTAQQLRAKQNSELADICKVVGVAVSGKKDVRIKRILDAQGSKEN